MIPQDPVMLLSFINLKLRDYYGSLEQLCDDLDVKEQEIRDKLASIDYHYNEERNPSTPEESLVDKSPTPSLGIMCI
jgi:hypothetical protein